MYKKFNIKFSKGEITLHNKRRVCNFHIRSIFNKNLYDDSDFPGAERYSGTSLRIIGLGSEISGLYMEK